LPEGLPRPGTDGREIAAALRAGELLESNQALPRRALIERTTHGIAVQIVVRHGVQNAVALAERPKMGRIRPRSEIGPLVGRNEGLAVLRSDDQRAIRLPEESGHPRAPPQFQEEPQRPAPSHWVVVVDAKRLTAGRKVVHP